MSCRNSEKIRDIDRLISYLKDVLIRCNEWDWEDNLMKEYHENEIVDMIAGLESEKRDCEDRKRETAF